MSGRLSKIAKGQLGVLQRMGEVCAPCWPFSPDVGLELFQYLLHIWLSREGDELQHVKG